MGRTKGGHNKEPIKPPHTVEMTTEQRVEFLANLVVDAILADQQNGLALLQAIERARHAAALPTVAA